MNYFIVNIYNYLNHQYDIDSITYKRERCIKQIIRPNMTHKYCIYERNKKLWQVKILLFKIQPHLMPVADWLPNSAVVNKTARTGGNSLFEAPPCPAWGDIVCGVYERAKSELYFIARDMSVQFNPVYRIDCSKLVNSCNMGQAKTNILNNYINKDSRNFAIA